MPYRGTGFSAYGDAQHALSPFSCTLRGALADLFFHELEGPRFDLRCSLFGAFEPFARFQCFLIPRQEEHLGSLDVSTVIACLEPWRKNGGGSAFFFCEHESRLVC